jgi:hypothetical protein
VKYPFGFRFVRNATLARVFAPLLGEKEINVSNSKLCLVMFLGLFFLMCILHFSYLDKCRKFRQQQDFIYWQTILIIILLSGPWTWVMNTIWLLPIIVVLIQEYQVMKEMKQAKYIYLCLFGLIIAALPDHHSFSLLFPFCNALLEEKYVIAEILLLISLLGLIKSRKNQQGG